MIDELPEFVKDNHVEIATLTLPKAKALDMAKLLVDVGVKAIWEFCPHRSESFYAGGCDRGKCTPFRKPDATFLQSEPF